MLEHDLIFTRDISDCSSRRESGMNVLRGWCRVTFNKIQEQSDGITEHIEFPVYQSAYTVVWGILWNG